MPESEKIRDFVRARYGAIADQVDARCGCGPSCCDAAAPAVLNEAKREEADAACCAPSCCRGEKSSGEKFRFAAGELAATPAGADLRLGCSHPLASAGLQPGETVRDLGSGAGCDCFLRRGNSPARVAGLAWT